MCKATGGGRRTAQYLCACRSGRETSARIRSAAGLAASGAKSFDDEWAQLPNIACVWICARMTRIGVAEGTQWPATRARRRGRLVSEVHDDVRTVAGSVPGTSANYNYRVNNKSH